MSTIADAKVAHNYNCYNGYFFGCLQIKNNSGKITFLRFFPNYFFPL